MKNSTRASRYSSIKILLQIAGIVLLLLYLILVQFSGGSHLLKTCAYGVTNQPYGALAVYFVLFSIAYYLLSFPLAWYAGYALEHQFSLSRQRFAAWLQDELKGAGLNFAVSLLLVVVLYALLRNCPHTWWVWMAAFWMFLTVVISRIFPTLILPLFYKYSDLDNETLRQRLLQLARRAGVKVVDTYKIDLSRKTSKANAALAGIGKSRRIILADTLLNDFSDEEIEAVLGHELGHHKLNHIPKILLFGGLVSCLMFFSASRLLFHSRELVGAATIDDIVMFPFLCLLLFSFSLLMLPLQNGFSRRLERASDGFALELTKNKDGFITAMNKLAEKNLADTAPNKIIEFIFYNHPSIAKRIAFAQTFPLSQHNE